MDAVLDVGAHAAKDRHQASDIEGFLGARGEEAQQAGAKWRLDEDAETLFDLGRNASRMGLGRRMGRGH